MDVILIQADGTPRKVHGKYHLFFGILPAVLFDLDGVAHNGFIDRHKRLDRLPVLRSYSPIITEVTQ